MQICVYLCSLEIHVRVVMVKYLDNEEDDWFTPSFAISTSAYGNNYGACTSAGHKLRCLQPTRQQV